MVETYIFLTPVFNKIDFNFVAIKILIILGTSNFNPIFK